MTPVEIDAMEAGPEMDALIHERVMGVPRVEMFAVEAVHVGDGHTGYLYAPSRRPQLQFTSREEAEQYRNQLTGKKKSVWRPTGEIVSDVDSLSPPLPYSTSDAAALEVFKKCDQLDTIEKLGDDEWRVAGCWDGPNRRTDDDPVVFATTLALAICRAALKAAL